MYVQIKLDHVVHKPTSTTGEHHFVYFHRDLQCILIALNTEKWDYNSYNWMLIYHFNCPLSANYNS